MVLYAIFYLDYIIILAFLLEILFKREFVEYLNCENSRCIKEKGKDLPIGTSFFLFFSILSFFVSCCSQQEFAEICEISRAYYGRIERGEHSATIDKCQKIANALNVRLADLFTEMPE